MIRKEKIKGIDYLLNRFQDKHLEFNTIPKCSFLLGAGCSISSEIPSGYDIIQKLRKLWFISNFKNGNEYKISDFEIDEEKFEKLEDEFQTALLEHETQLVYKVEKSIEKLKKEHPKYLKKLLDEIKEDDLKNNFFINAYPNPSNEFILFEMPAMNHLSIPLEIIDTRGTIISNFEIHETNGLFTQQLNISDLAQGMYFVRVQIEGQFFVKRFVKVL